MAGNDLLKTMAAGTGLPQELLVQELTALLERAQVSKDACSLDDLRAVLSEYAQEILLAAKEAYTE